uniref:Uncharacterized protein n=1 Tax=Ursus maritimus TaxID=29073 RepID=A0A452TKQ4_URSMA
MTEQMTLCGTLKDHNGWLTQIPITPQFLDMILSIVVDKLKQEVISTSSKAKQPQCTSLAPSADGQIVLFLGVQTWRISF